MKTTKLRFLFITIMLCLFCDVRAQEYGPDCLGIWKRLSPAPSQVNKNLGYIKFTVDVPPEGVPRELGFKVYGPSVLQTECWGNTFDFYIEYNELLLESQVTNNVVTYMFPTNLIRREPFSGSLRRCYYHLEVNLRDLPAILESL